jgi:hypothetical protein
VAGDTKKSERIKINLPFDEAMRRAVKVKPPPEGWEEHEKHQRRKKTGARKRKRA